MVTVNKSDRRIMVPMIAAACVAWFGDCVRFLACSLVLVARHTTIGSTIVPNYPLILATCLMATLVAQQPEHWSYRPIVRPAADLVVTEPGSTSASATAGARHDWLSSPLDVLVFQAMQPHGLQPSPPAQRATWLRRVTLDLTGLPPTTAELDVFLSDGKADARERVVEQLLSSDAFAERWAAWWLDLARYADSQGYEKDALRRSMWRYRDWVIAAFRDGMPFDQFTVEQLAGDLLPNATIEQRVATAFHRQTMTNTEGGTDNEEFRVAAIVDRVDTTMSVWTGSTLGCAQCHDHKYDPFSQREFFELFAFFDQTEDADRDNDAPTLRVPTPQDQAAVKAIELDLTRARAELAAVRETAVAKPTMTSWHLLGPIQAANFDAARETKFTPETRGVLLQEEQDGSTWQLREDLVDGKVHTWSGANSAFYLHRMVTSSAASQVVLSLGSDDVIAVWWNGKQVLNKNVSRAAGADQEILTVDAQAGDNELLLKVTNGGSVGGFYFQLWSAGERELQQRIRQLEKEFDEHQGPAVPILRDLPEDQWRTTRVHIRGSFLDQGDVVHPGTPSVLAPFGDELPRNRLGLARWLMSRDNPLTARVLSNRIWSELFGQGIVLTLEDFGSQGDRPTHPKLLDYLAAEFMDSGWSLRHLLRTIVLSQTYSQSSAQTDAQRELDPNNDWLARGPAFRLSAEQLRDQALACAGLLHERVGGASVMPPQPDGIWRQIYSGAKWQDATGEDRYRRSLYTFWRRTSPHPAMLMFDAQSREACVLRRRRTNTPLQALVLWNDPQFHEPAQELGRRAMQVAVADDASTAAARGIAWLWRQCLLREPTPMEASRLLALLDDERQHGVAESEAWGMVASVVICLDEFVTKR